MYDYIRFCDVNHYGTARSAALGNAMTAVGGDLGSIGINPAGAAVAGYSQFTITPGLSISSTQSSYTPVAREQFTSVTPDSQTRFILPNMGFVLNMDTGRKSGIKNFTFGLTVNTTNVYNEPMSAGGVNSLTSMLGEMAFYASPYDLTPDFRFPGIPYSSAMGENAFRSEFSWPSILAIQSGMVFNPIRDANDRFYIGSSELLLNDGTTGMPDGSSVNQLYYRVRTGSKTESILNLAFNYEDKFYMGVNLGIPSIRFSESTNLLESPVNEDDFVHNFWNEETQQQEFGWAWLNARRHYSLETEATGIYGKLGFIWLPFEGLRLGGAVQTPTLYSISERYFWNAVCNLDGIVTSEVSTPMSENEYSLVSPFNFNLGAAYTLGGRALVSVDWERTDFRSMRRRVSEYDDIMTVNNENADIRQLGGKTNHIRVGLEYKPVEAFALRAGYSFKQYKEKSALDITHTGSIGFGYSSPGSFFMDCAVRYSMVPDDWFYPYDDYNFDVDDNGQLFVTTRSPEVCIKNNLMDVILTLGWRF